MKKVLNGDPVKNEIGERSNPTPYDANRLVFNTLPNTYGPTSNQKASFNRTKRQLQGIKTKLKSVMNTTISDIEQKLKQAGAPWIEGQGLIEN